MPLFSRKIKATNDAVVLIRCEKFASAITQPGQRNSWTQDDQLPYLPKARCCRGTGRAYFVFALAFERLLNGALHVGEFLAQLGGRVPWRSRSCPPTTLDSLCSRSSKAQRQKRNPMFHSVVVVLIHCQNAARILRPSSIVRRRASFLSCYSYSKHADITRGRRVTRLN